MGFCRLGKDLGGFLVGVLRDFIWVFNGIFLVVT